MEGKPTPAVAGPHVNPGSRPGGVRRSSRANMGQPPNRYGEWTQGLSTPLTSTRLDARGTPLRRTTIVVPPDAVISSRADDNDSVVSSGSARSRSTVVEEIDMDISNLEASIADKLSKLESMKQRREEEMSKLLEQPEFADVELEDEDFGAAGFSDSVVPPVPVSSVGLPRGGVPGYPLSSLAEPPKTMTMSKSAEETRDPMVGQKARNQAEGGGFPKTFGGYERGKFYGGRRLFAETSAQRATDDRYGGKAEERRFSGGQGWKQEAASNYAGASSATQGYGIFGPVGATGGPGWGGALTPGPTPGVPFQQAQNPTGVDALAAALVQALTLQSQNTERFVARQSHGSQLPTFTGNPLDWPLFAHHFIQSTRDCGFTAAQNMARLEKALRGEARKTVRSLMIIPGNSEAVMQTLQQRYGRPEYVIQALVDLARKTPTPKENKLSTLVDFAIAVRNLVVTINTLGEFVYLQNPQLLQELVDKLPDNLKLQWGMAALGLGRTANLQDFCSWIETASMAESMVVTPKMNFNEKKEESTFMLEEETSTSKDKGAGGGKQPTEKPSSFSGGTGPKPCWACEKEAHGINNCEMFGKLSYDERWNLTRTKGRCFRCLRGGHSLRTCKVKTTCGVDRCSKRHHTLLHSESADSPKDTSKGKEVKKVEEINSSYSVAGGSGLLRIVVVSLYGPSGEMVVNALLDGASSVTLMCAELAKEMGLDGATDPLRIRWTDESVQQDNSSKKVDLWIGPVGETDKYKIKSVRTVEKLKLTPQRSDLREIVKRYPHLQSRKLKYLPGERPMILVGQQHAHLITTREVVEKDEHSPMLSRTKLGWVVHGPRNGRSEEESTNVCYHESDADILHNLVKESFALESIGIKTAVSSRSREDQAAEEMMERVTRRVGERWETGLLWKREHTKLPSSREVAVKRLISIERKLKRNEGVAAQYKEKIAHYLETGYARKLSEEELRQPSDVEWYLPHFDRHYPNKPGKIRIVFDAASRSRGVSLNDHLLTGPDLLVSLVGVLLKFRQRQIAVSGDIAEMFHQVRIRQEDCPAQRFLWREDERAEPSTFQLEVMMFGSVCSPYCAQYVKNRNAMESKEEFPKAVAAIVHKHYMDDYLDSLDTEEEALNLALEVTTVHKSGGFDIGKWMSNSDKVLEALLGDSKTSVSKSFTEWSEVQTERALGLHWVPEVDAFTFRVNLERAGEGIATGEVNPTKRAVLRLVMLVWDPLGFLGHYIVKARILIQDLWRTKIGWDDQLTERQFRKWKLWVKDLSLLSNIKIGRCYSSQASSSTNVTLHIFADSSEAASCSVAYLRVVEGEEVSVSLVMSKTRVAPVKPCSVPRLELTAALIACRLGKFIQSELDIKIHGVTYWTDSMTVLKWIRSEARRYQQFVANRVGEIQETTEVSQWRWVPSAENPADDGTRDGKADLSEGSRWWCGPDFLKLPPEDFPQERRKDDVEEDEEELELRREFVGVIVEVEEFAIPEVARFSNYLRLLRSTAYILRLSDRLRKLAVTRQLPVHRAELLLCRRSQWTLFPQEMQLLSSGQPVPTSSRLYELSPVLDTDGVLRMDSRLASSKYKGQRQPVILDPKEQLTVLPLGYHHKIFGHAGEDLVRNEVRQRFWIPRIRSAVRRSIGACLVCRKKRAQAHPPVMAALPEVKIQPQPRPFYITGMDYFGPMDVTVGRRHEKRWGVLFTCMNTRAVHLEVAASLSTDSCILAIRRMIARRGQPFQLHSDNGTNLRGADKELRQALKDLDQERISDELETKQIEWHFIPPSAAHMGGSWERLVRPVKVALSAVLKCRAPKEEILQTVFAEAEAIVNSRPLVEVPVDPESPEALTPFHFLIGSSSANSPPGKFKETRIDLEKLWKQSQALADQFWKRWLKEYLPTLQRRTKWHKQRPSIEKGDMVVVLDQSLRRSTWPLGLVVQTYPGKDGIVRVADVKTATGIYTRPVVKLAKLDVKAVGTDHRD